MPGQKPEISRPDFLEELESGDPAEPLPTKGSTTQPAMIEIPIENLIHCQYCEDCNPRCLYCGGRWVKND